MNPPKHYTHDQLTFMDFISRLEDDDQDDNSGDLIPIRLLGGGEHFKDVAGDVGKQQELYNDTLMIQILIVPEQSCWIMSYLETSIALGHLIRNYISIFYLK